MTFNISEILKAWVTAANPNDVQRELAEERLDICMKCEFRKEVIHNKEWSALCGKCGCPISKKIFTDQYGSCPLNKWDIIEGKYIIHLKKKNKSII
jgi:hypothetical protein